MHDNKIVIRKIRFDEISLIRDFPPVDWNLDLEMVYKQHFDKDYFYPIIGLIDNKIVGTGIAVVHDNVTWIGTIIVLDNYRNQGIGNRITKQLIDYSIANGKETILLTASELGFPIYKKIGFKHDFDYLFFRTDKGVEINGSSDFISNISFQDYSGIFELDYLISGEKRKKLLTTCMKTGYKYQDDKLKGFYLPDFGSGLIIADTGIVGLELLKFRLAHNKSPICIPESNTIAIRYLESLGFYQFFKTPRMYLNGKIDCISKKIFSRGSGYLG